MGVKKYATQFGVRVQSEVRKMGGNKTRKKKTFIGSFVAAVACKTVGVSRVMKIANAGDGVFFLKFSLTHFARKKMEREKKLMPLKF